MNRQNTILAIITVLGLASCQQVFFEEPPKSDPKGIFQQVWDFTDREYSFFAYKGIDWDAVYLEYAPKISNDMHEEALFDTLANMLYILEDGHVNMKSSFNRSRNWSWYLESPDNFDKYLLEREYFDEKQQIVGPFVVYDFGDVGYVYYESFTSTVTSSQMNYILDKFSNYKGLIIDVRNNFGGSLSNVYTIGNHLVDEETDVALSRQKSGPAHDDFTDFSSITFSPDKLEQEEPTTFTKPIVVLTNRKSYSAGNYFPTCMSALPYVTIMGDTTGGGGGAPSATELTNGWTLRVSATQLYTLDEVNVENGLPPDEVVRFTETDRANGVDPILERALSFLRQ